MVYKINQKAREALDKLAAMPGMGAVKDQVEQMINFSRVAKLREQNKLKTSQQSNHMIFTGNPGTGKTTAARMIGKVFAEIGLLQRDDEDDMPFVEVNHSMIAHPHVGEAERRMAAKFLEAKGGVLFIDEAYSFIGKSEHRTDEKVVATMVQHIEDMRDDLIVIAAGYPKDMAEFISFNPGLASRFPTTIHFPDYTVPELVKIAEQMLFEREYQASPDYLDALASVLWIEKSRPNFGNARTVRNHVERSIRRQAMRVSGLPQPSRKDLATLLPEDLVHSVNDVKSTEKLALQRTIQEAQHRLLELDLKGILKGSSE